jgi:hypothetical protein
MNRLRTLASDYWPFAALFLYFLWPFLSLREAFILNDYALQHLPWAVHTFEAARKGGLPLWTNAMAFGFPLFAEGQSASLYFFNWVGYRALPFEVTYGLSVPFHFLAGAAGMALYVRRMGLSGKAACLAAAVFCFSSAFAGCFYNTGSLRVLCWLPMQLWLLELIASRHKRSGAAFGALAFLVAQQWLGGFPQMTVYAAVYLIVHELLVKRWRMLFVLAAAGVFGMLMAWPQISATLELIGHSVRNSESLAFALWGSVPPAAPVSLLFPEWGVALRFSFYLGIAPLFFAAASLFLKVPAARHLWLALLFFTLALGRFNPVYAWLVDALDLTFLRNPAKFLFFVNAALAAAAAFGLDAVLSARERGRTPRFAFWFAGAAALLPLAGTLLRSAAVSMWPKFSDWYVSRLATEKGAGADTERYRGIMEAFFVSLRDLFSYLNPLNLRSIGAAAAALALFHLFFRKKVSARVFLALISLLTVWDLGSYGMKLGIGFTGNEAPWSSLKPSPQAKAVLDRLRQSPGIFAELVNDANNEMFPPNAGMSLGLKQAGGYSPLLLRGYYEKVRGLGIADSSLGRAPMRDVVWSESRALLDGFGVRYIRTDHPLGWEGLNEVFASEGSYLYENARAEGPVAVTQGTFHMLPGSSSADLGFHFHMAEDGTAVVRTAAYPGWRLSVDGVEAPWKRVEDIFIGFDLKKGDRDVRLYFSPSSWPMAWYAAIAGLTLAIIGALLWQKQSII